MSQENMPPSGDEKLQSEAMKRISARVARKRNVKGQPETGASVSTTYCCTTLPPVGSEE